MEEAATMLIPCGFGMGMDVLGIEELPDNDFMAFLGDLAVDPFDPTSAGVVSTTIPAPGATAPKAPPLQLPSAADPSQTSWQVTTGQLLKQPSMRGSPCSSAASADETNCPESPMVTSAVTSSEAAHTAPASAATAATTNTTAVATRKRQRPQASPTPSLQTQSEGTAPESQDEPHLTKAQLAAAKRRAPVVDWRAIDDPEERRKQRRLAKNRVTAARSRERKKEQMAEMEERLSQLEAENGSLRALLQTMMGENTGLKEQLASLTRGAAAAPTALEGSPKPAVLVKCLAIMHLVCCLLMCAEASWSSVSSLMSLVSQQGACAGASAGSCGVGARICVVSAAASSRGSCAVPCHKAAAVREWWRVRLRSGVSVWV